MAKRRKTAKSGNRVWFELAIICILTGLAAYLGNWGKNEEAARNSRPAVHRQQARQDLAQARADKATATVDAKSQKKIRQEQSRQPAAEAPTAQRKPAAAQPAANAQAKPSSPQGKTPPGAQTASTPAGKAPANPPSAPGNPPKKAPVTQRHDSAKPDERKASLAAAAGRPSPSAENREYRLAYVGDGDSLELIDNRNVRIRVRLYGIDAPEAGQKGGQESKANLTRLLQGKKVQIRTLYTDNYQRAVSLVYLRQNGRTDALSINQRQVQAGMAWVYDYFCTSDICNTWKLEEALAQKQKIGLWKEDSPTPPWQWRKTHPRQ